MIEFPTDIEAIQERMIKIDPVKYASTRNFADGKVTYLSPYISRGFISTRTIYDHLMTIDLPWFKLEKLIQELAWRDYWQQVWITKRNKINSDLKYEQSPVSNYGIPETIVNGNTGIHAVDNAIKKFYGTGYLHNHMRMYVASICCNIAHSHWLTPSKWMYAHLLDGDLASNQLSWQWVAGTFSSKKYYANQNNINKYFMSSQINTFLDIEYEQFSSLKTPFEVSHIVPFYAETPLPDIKQPTLEKDKITLLYNYYNLDPYWYKGEDAQRILLLEPSLFKENPVSQKCIDFVLKLAKNIKGLKVFVGEFAQLQNQINTNRLVFKEHPANRHYRGKKEERDWLTSVTGYFPSFFAFWKKCKKELMR